MLIDFNREEWSKIYAVLVHDILNFGDLMTDEDNAVQLAIIERIQNRVIDA